LLTIAFAEKLLPTQSALLAISLAEVLAKAEWSEDEARAWRRDLRAGRSILKPPAKKWR
jgi:predicted transcriptional regulator